MQKFHQILTATLLLGALFGAGAASAEPSCCSKDKTASTGAKACCKEDAKACCKEGPKTGWFVGAGDATAVKAGASCCEGEKAKGGDDKGAKEKASDKGAKAGSCCSGEK